jgi:predicted transposase YbfD/YdcC
LLRLLELKGCIVSLDALPCQKATVAEIREQQADYVVALKSNQGQMYEAVKAFLEMWKKVGHIFLRFRSIRQ